MGRPLKITTIVCEEIRAELGNKHSALGIYSGDIIVHELPANIRISFMLIFDTLAPGTHRINIRMSLGRREVFGGTTSIDVKLNESATVVAPGGLLALDKESTSFRLTASVDGARRVTLAQKRIVFSPPLAPIAPTA